MGSTLQNLVVVGGSYVGKGMAARLAQICPPTHRVLLIEPHSHFNHIFTFPRFALIPGYEHKAFIPYTAQFSSAPRPDSHAIVPARVVSIQHHSLKLDREWERSTEIPFDYLVLATGTTLTQPSAVKEDGKVASIKYLRKHQDQVKKAKSILIAGGGAAGVQMATDLKEYFPDKQVTLVQSRDHLMPKFHYKLHELIKRRFDELGVNFRTGARVVIPPGGFPDEEGSINVELSNGGSVRTDFVILATGQQANNSPVSGLDSSSGGAVLNPENGMVRVRPTLQFADSKYDNLFAVGDIADTGAHKAARPGMAQADVVTANIKSLLDGQTPKDAFTVAPAAIHITLGMTYNVIFRNPNPAEGQTEPTAMEKQDGREDMGVDGFWERMGVPVRNPSDYML